MVNERVVCILLECILVYADMIIDQVGFEFPYLRKRLTDGSVSSPLADLEFPRWGANLLFGKLFAGNCMKIK